MAEVAIVVGVHTEYLSHPDANPDSFIGASMRRTRFRVDAEWVVLDPKHHWMLVVNGFPLVWLGPYWSDIAIMELAHG